MFISKRHGYKRGRGLMSNFHNFMSQFMRTKGPELLKTVAKDVGQRLVSKTVDKITNRVSPNKQAIFNKMFGRPEQIKGAISNRFNQLLDGRAITIQDLVKGSGLMIR